MEKEFVKAFDYLTIVTMRYSLFFLLALMFVVSISNAQTIPNAGFETWSNPNGYNIPEGWATLNDMTTLSGVYTCTKGTPGSPGYSYLKLTSKAVAGMGVMPGIAVSGTLNANTLAPTSGFAYANRPTALTGKWQYMGATANDIGSIQVYLTHWDAVMNMRDTVGVAAKSLTGMVMSWATFTIPFTYNNTNSPDTCIMIMNASGAAPANNSYLYVDNLSFTGVTGIDNHESMGTFSVFPNPAQSDLHLNLDAVKTKIEKIEIVNIDGKVLKALLHQVDVVSVEDIPTGIYAIKIYSSRGFLNQLFLKK